jgi:hypothetical protein
VENYSTWCKYQNEAAVHLLRWNAEFTERVWSALCADLAPFLSGPDSKALNPITAALILRKQVPTALAHLAAKFDISEKQIWALLLDHADPATTSLDTLSDARDQIRRLTAQEDFAEQQRLHPNFNYVAEVRKQQSGRAKQPRLKIGDGENASTLTQEIEKLALAPRYAELSAKQLWPIFIGLLDEYHLDPVEDTSDPLNSKCTYDLGGQPRQISFKRFSNAVAKSRNKKSH